MASNDIIIRFDGDVRAKMKQDMRDILICEGLGVYWEDYCYQNNIAPEIKLGFLDFLSRLPDETFNNEDGSQQ